VPLSYVCQKSIVQPGGVEPYEIAEDHWEFNYHLCGDGPSQEYLRNGVYHIEEPPFYGGRRKSSDV
jgi:hypothetical protein